MQGTATTPEALGWFPPPDRNCYSDDLAASPTTSEFQPIYFNRVREPMLTH